MARNTLVGFAAGAAAALVLLVAVPLAFASDWHGFGGMMGSWGMGDGHMAGHHSGDHHSSGHHHGGGSGATPPNATTVYMDGNAFSPGEITVQVGATVTWTNLDAVEHTVTSDSGNELASPMLGKGESWSHTFTEPGTYRYHCIPHAGRDASGTYRGMVGVVHVVEE